MVDILLFNNNKNDFLRDIFMSFASKASEYLLLTV